MGEPILNNTLAEAHATQSADKPITQQDWTAQYNPHAVAINIAAGILGKSKPELVEIVGNESMREVEEGLAETLVGATRFFQEIVTMLECSLGRILGAEAAAKVQA